MLRISEINVAFAPAKTGNHNSLQISFMKEGTTRHIYVYHEDSEVITNWYMAIRCAKLHRLQVAYPGTSESELIPQLTKDFPKEGFLWKTGPKHSDAYKKRWFTLDGRKLMYHDDPMVTFYVIPSNKFFQNFLRNGKHWFNKKIFNISNCICTKVLAFFREYI